MALYVFRPKADDIAKESLTYFQRMKELTRARLDYAERADETVNANYDKSPTNQWQWGSLLEHSAIESEIAMKLHQSVLHKLDWENKTRWAEKFPKLPPHASPEPWRDDPVVWAKCFELDSEDKI
jgi:hypothetical protein